MLLSEKEKEEITETVRLSNEKDGTSHEPVLDADMYFFSRHYGEIVSFAALCLLGEEYSDLPVTELQLFTRPDMRRKGRAERVYEKALEYSAGEVLKVQAYPSGISKNFLSSHGFSKKYDELLMEYGTPVLSGTGAQELHFENEHSSLEMAVYGDSAYIYDVRTDASHLREGYGERLMRSVLKEYDGKLKGFILQVSSENTPAFSLYKKLGFRVSEKLEMWYNVRE